jgi:3'(2'), 5'-bisphosphate nucleotidase
MDPIQRKELVEALLPIAMSAGAAILERRAKHYRVRLKSDRSPVTEADLESQDVILDGCRRLCPSIPIISEENASASSGALPSTCLLIDPLDGTKEFVAGRDEFAVNLALVEDGIPTAGIIFAPAIGRLFFSADNDHVFERLRDGERRALRCRPADMSAPPVILASRSHLDEQTAALIALLKPRAVHRIGSSLKFAMIAAGEADLYPRLSPTMSWDSAAGQALIEAAGGVVLRLDGTRLRCSSDIEASIEGFIAAGSRNLAEHALTTLRALQDPH